MLAAGTLGVQALYGRSHKVIREVAEGGGQRESLGNSCRTMEFDEMSLHFREDVSVNGPEPFFVGASFSENESILSPEARRLNRRQWPIDCTENHDARAKTQPHVPKARLAAEESPPRNRWRSTSLEAGAQGRCHLGESAIDIDDRTSVASRKGRGAALRRHPPGR